MAVVVTALVINGALKASGQTTFTPGDTKICSAAKGSAVYYKVTVPSGQCRFSVWTYGDSAFGNCDLYVKRGSLPTLTSYDKRSILSGQSEAVEYACPASGTYYVMLYGKTAFSRASLRMHYYAGSLAVPKTVTCLSGGAGSCRYYRIDQTAAGIGKKLAIYTTGSGDCDLYVRNSGYVPCLWSYDYRSAKASSCSERVVINQSSSADTVYVMVCGYRSYSGVTLTVRYE
jgi:hypothetical protein